MSYVRVLLVLACAAAGAIGCVRTIDLTRQAVTEVDAPPPDAPTIDASPPDASIDAPSPDSAIDAM